MKNKAGYLRDVTLLAEYLMCNASRCMLTNYADSLTKTLAIDYHANLEMVKSHIRAACRQLV